MFDTWLAEPHIQGWWGDGSSQWQRLATADPSELGQPVVDMRIVELDGTPFAYIQDYQIHAYNMPHYTHLPRRSRAIDTFLGDPNYLSQGHAARYLHQRAKELHTKGAPCIAVDPKPNNHSAIAAYRTAGFQGDTISPSEDGSPALILTYPSSYS